MVAILFAIAFNLPLLFGFIAIQVALLQGVNKHRASPLSFWKLVVCASIGSLIGVLIGLGVGFLVMFGPSYMTGDFIGLPWLTMVPGLIIGLIAIVATSYFVSRRLVIRAQPQ